MDTATKMIVPLILLCHMSCTAGPRPEGHVSMTSADRSSTGPTQRVHAKATVTVLSSEARPYDQAAKQTLIEINIAETFTGDIDGKSNVRALEMRLNDHSSTMVSMQRFVGKLGGRQGAFVLQGREIVENGKIRATWFVVPGSGTDKLSGLRGEGGFEGSFGKNSEATLDYWFEDALK